MSIILFYWLTMVEKSIKAQFFWFLVIFAWVCGGAHAAEPFVKTPEQRDYLAQRDDITLCVDPDWMPYEAIDGNGRHVGIAADYMGLFADMIGKPLRLVETESWAQSEAFARERRCDLLSMLNESDTRREYLNFTSPYMEASVVLVAQSDVPFIDGLQALSGKTLAMVKGYSYEDVILEQYPLIELVYVDSMEQAYEKVSDGEIFSTMGTLYVATSQIQQLGLSNLKIAGPTGLRSYFRVGVRNDDPILLSLFQAAIDNLNPIEENEILKRWISVRLETGTDYRLAVQVLSIAALISALLLYRNWSVRKLLAQLNHANQQLEIKSEALSRLSRTDSLTKLHNRFYLDEQFKTELQRFERYGTAFCCVLLDVDRFKEVNDLYGHAVGDAVLQQLATLLKSSVRFNDIVGRWGGEEFLIICPQTNESGAQTLAETLRAKIEQQRFATVSNLTCSFGVAEIQQDQTEAQLLVLADEALYRAKTQGRNRVCVALAR